MAQTVAAKMMLGDCGRYVMLPVTDLSPDAWNAFRATVRGHRTVPAPPA